MPPLQQTKTYVFRIAHLFTFELYQSEHIRICRIYFDWATEKVSPASKPQFLPSCRFSPFDLFEQLPEFDTRFPINWCFALKLKLQNESMEITLHTFPSTSHILHVLQLPS